jgi:hypothetical protein
MGAPQLPQRLVDRGCCGVVMGLQKKQSPRGVGRAGWWVGAQADLALVLNV